MNLLSAMAGMFLPELVNRTNVYRATRIHATKKGPDRSSGMKRKNLQVGRKLEKKAFLGTLTLRNGIGAAGRLALMGK